MQDQSSQPVGQAARELFGYAILIFALNVAASLLNNAYNYQMQRLGTRQRLGLMLLMFRKSLRLTAEARSRIGVGAMVSHMQIDSDLISQGTYYVNQLWGLPLQLMVCLLLLYREIGWSGFTGATPVPTVIFMRQTHVGST